MALAAEQTAAAHPGLDVLIVDDSEVVCRLVSAVVDADPGLRVVGTAGNGMEALDAVERLRPDAIVLDVTMPVMTGLQAFQLLRERHPMVGVVFFVNTDSYSDELTSALTCEAADLVPKPTGFKDMRDAIIKTRNVLLPKIYSVARSAASAAPAVAAAATPAAAVSPVQAELPRAQGPPGSRRPVEAIVVGASTGGPVALEEVFRGVRHSKVPIYVVQHISAEFSGQLVERLDRTSKLTVVEAEHGMRPQPNTVYVAPGGVHLAVARQDKKVIMELVHSEPVNSCRPSVDVLFESAAATYHSSVLGVVLTGIGEDGLDGCRALSAVGAPVIVQDEASSVVWGMPSVVAKAGLATEIVPLDEVATRLSRWLMITERETAVAQ